jgi:pimeloyl-ACP methyl ester carboxylesterase
MERTPFTVPTETGEQRGLAPSTLQGEFTVAEAVADIAALLDGLGWESAYLVGHSWGGHLAFHAACAIPHRLAGVLSVDPLGAVGDSGMAAFGAEMLARVPEGARERARVLDEKDTAGKATPEEQLEAVFLFWASYFADPPAAPAMPHVEFSQQANQGLWADLTRRLPELESSLPSLTVPFGVIVGELSPEPATWSGTKRRAASWQRWTSSSRARARRIRRSSGVVDDARRVSSVVAVSESASSATPFPPCGPALLDSCRPAIRRDG